MSFVSAVPSLLILVAASRPSDANSAALRLRGLGHQVVTCTTTSKMLELEGSQEFSVVLAESRPGGLDGHGDSVEAVRLLENRRTSSSPVIVAMDKSDAAAVSRVMQQGAIDVVGLPLQDQQQLLENLWTQDFTPRTALDISLPTCHADFAGAADGCLHPAALMMAEADTLAALDHLEPLPCDFLAPPRDDPEVPDASVFQDMHDLFACGDLDSIPSEGDFDILESFSAEEPSYLSSSTSSTLSDRKRSREDTDESSSHPGPSAGPDESLPPSSLDGTKHTPKGKRSKVGWTTELHNRFVLAVESLGVKEAVPSRIIEHMGQSARGLTRKNIASHLQKYRRKSRSYLLAQPQQLPTLLSPAPSGGLQGAAMIPAPGLTAPLVPATSALGGMPGPAPLGLQHSLQLRVAAQQWPMVQMWGPWPQAAAVSTRLSHPAGAFSGGMLLPQANAHQPGVTSETVKTAIMDVLAAPKANAPLGLSLDMSSIFSSLQTLGLKHDGATSSAPTAGVA